MRYVQIKLVGRKIPVKLFKTVIAALPEDGTVLVTGAGQKLLQTIINYYPNSDNNIEQIYENIVSKLPYDKRILTVKVREKSESNSE